MRRILRGCVLAITGALVAVVILASPAAAHTEFERSVPGEGEKVRGPLSEIRLFFVNEASEAGEGFVVLDPERGRISPDEVKARGGGVFVLEFDEPLSPGDVGVRWTVRAPDVHPISGAFAFKLRPEARPEKSGSEPAAAAPPPATPGADPELEEFLAEEGGSDAGAVVARAGRALAFIGVAAAIGLAIFGFAVMRGSPKEVRQLISWVRIGGFLIIIGTVADASGQVMVDGGGASALFSSAAWTDTWSSSLGIAWVFRLVGGGLVAYGARGEVVAAASHRDPLRSVVKALPAASPAPGAAVSQEDSGHRESRLRLSREALPLATGLALLILTAHSFDGHTVNEGNRLLTSIAAGVHVLAGSIWAAGVVALAWLIWTRTRRREPSGGLVLAARFSVVAGASLAMVFVVGVYLAVVILDAPSGLWQTDWGLILLVKTAIVALAVGLGGYNHFRLIPRIDEGGEGPAAVAQLGRTLRVEGALMLSVLVLSAILVRASSVA